MVILAYSTYVKYQKISFFPQNPVRPVRIPDLFNLRDFLDSKIQIQLFVGCGYLSANSRSTFRNLGVVLSRIKSVTTQRHTYSYKHYGIFPQTANLISLKSCLYSTVPPPGE